MSSERLLDDVEMKEVSLRKENGLGEERRKVEEEEGRRRRKEEKEKEKEEEKKEHCWSGPRSRDSFALGEEEEE